MEQIPNFFRWLYEATGMNFSVFYDIYEWNLFVKGIGYTLFLSISSIIGSVLLGVIGAYCQSSASAFWRYLVTAYVWVFRNTPQLVQLYFFYFALGPFVGSLIGSTTPVLTNLNCALLSLVLYAGAYNVEIFRSGIQAVPETMIEAASSLGLKRIHIFRYIIFPLAARICLPALSNNMVNLIKTTAIAYVVAVPEVLYVSSQIWADHLNVLEMMIVLLTFYLSIVGVFVYSMGILEKKLSVSGWGRT
jgi:polar amino acid transport system permease protein